MTSKRILVLNGHPGVSSLSRQFVKKYHAAAQMAGNDLRVYHLSKMMFDADFGQGSYSQFKALEPDLEAFLSDLEWAQHFVVAMPMWWGGMPAKLKGLFDRTLIPGRTFNAKIKRFGMPSPMLTGKTARVIMTSDTPMWLERIMYRRAIMHQTSKQIMAFVGIKPTKYTYFSGASEAAEAKVSSWLAQVETIGKNAA